MKENRNLPANFRKLPISARQQAVQKLYSLSERELSSISGRENLSDLSDILVEGAVGAYPVPFGIAAGFLIDGIQISVPMATEEPSVIIAATHGALLVKAGGGFETWASPPVMTAQIFLKNPKPDTKSKILLSERMIKETVNEMIPQMVKRGGGFSSLEAEEILKPSILAVQVHINVQDAMGANIVNTVAERLKPVLKELTHCEALMGVLTNASYQRRAKASFSIPEKLLKKAPYSCEEVCQNIVLANDLANHFPERAVTHNKGIMNGISALTLATGNDTRAIEAASHFYAQAEGRYRALTSYAFKNGRLSATLELPLPLGTVGGSISIWPPSKIAMKLLGHPNGEQLSRIAAAVGLAQNLSALLALVTEGIQEGHMKMHAAKVAYAAGARGAEARILAAKLCRNKTQDQGVAVELLKMMRS